MLSYATWDLSGKSPAKQSYCPVRLTSFTQISNLEALIHLIFFLPPFTLYVKAGLYHVQQIPRLEPSILQSTKMGNCCSLPPKQPRPIDTTTAMEELMSFRPSTRTPKPNVNLRSPSSQDWQLGEMRVSRHGFCSREQGLWPGVLLKTKSSSSLVRVLPRRLLSLSPPQGKMHQGKGGVS